MWGTHRSHTAGVFGRNRRRARLTKLPVVRAHCDRQHRMVPVSCPNRFALMIVVLGTWFHATACLAGAEPPATTIVESVPAEGITVLRVANCVGSVHVTAAPGQDRITVARTAATPPAGMGVSVTVERRANMLHVRMVRTNADGGRTDRSDGHPTSPVPVTPPADSHWAGLEITTPVKLNVDMDAQLNVRVTGLEGMIRATSAYGDVVVNDLRGWFDVTTGGIGAVRMSVRRLDCGGNHARSEDGDIRLQLSRAIPATVYATAEYAAVFGPSPGSPRRSAVLERSGGGLSIWLRSRGGAITVE